MSVTPRTSGARRSALHGFLAAGVVLLAGCKSVTPVEKPRNPPQAAAASAASTGSPSTPAVLPVTVPAPAPAQRLPANPQVMVYASATTEAALAKSGVSARAFAQQWEQMLRRHRIPGGITTSIDDIERLAAPVLVLPGASHLTAREMVAVASYRARGGSVLATGAVGSKDENGKPLGYGFMENTLGVGVAGTTEKEENDTFMIPFGDNPVSHSLPAGHRVWLERVKDFYPLRLTGGQPAATIMDWSRSAAGDKPATLIAFDERVDGERASRAVVFGFSERLWDTLEPRAINALAHDALMWLLRLPSANVASWPHPALSATVVAIDSADPLIDTDLGLPAAIAGEGARASYFILSETAPESLELIKKIRLAGHDVGYMGDRFEGFKNQPPAVQRKRMQTALTELQNAGVAMVRDAGVHPVMDSLDNTTIDTLRDIRAGYVVVGAEETEARLPFFAGGEGAPDRERDRMVLLPRTQVAADDVIGEGDPKVGMRTFLRELELAHAGGALSMLRILGQTTLEEAQMRTIRTAIAARRDRTWIATGREVANWWRTRSHVSVTIDSMASPPLLVATINAMMPPTHAPSVLVTLPRAGARLQLRAAPGQILPAVAGFDDWRAALVLDGLPPGIYRWQLVFNRPRNKDVTNGE
ncbi:type 1 glutamine amidotransferase family protein [Noviherbaspirillum galbum]|uniref:NodB homology domain-containing protein n=1 Tax=Noviherbaspirillum galbum TaxID=2709383 RepID=A0A6B3SRL6_9BURK|nr:hypothetical protein [Noviherbaspirillum galbum]NEX61072.1 hypothetical protein [Noviherbaspirillum galbum]